MKKIAIISDLHCGHRAGLTPPKYQYQPERSKYGEAQKSIYEQYLAAIERWSPVDVLIVNGDAIDGKGDRTGGSELITSDRDEQVEMAYEAITAWKAPTIIMTYGTGYHTGKEEDWEAVLCSELNAEIHAHVWPEIDGVIFDVKHFAPGSVVPYGRYTGPARSRVWNLLWNERELQPKARVFIRSHVHAFTHSGDSRHLVMTTPALQAPSTKYGARQCEGTVDCGFVVFTCDEGKYAWKLEEIDIRFSAQQTTKI